MNIVIFVLIVTVAAFCGGLAGSLIKGNARQNKRQKRRPGERSAAGNKKEQTMTTLLHGHECPVGYNCLATDCMKCLEIHMEKGAANGAQKE